MRFFQYTEPQWKNFLPIESIVNQPAIATVLRDNFFRTVIALQNKSNGAYYLYKENITSLPFKQVVDRIIGLYNDCFFEFYFVRRWLSGSIGGPDKACLKDRYGNVIARTEKVFDVADTRTQDLIIRPVHTFHVSNQIYHMQFKEYLNSVGFFDSNGFPKRELELFDSNNQLCIWGGTSKPARDMSVFTIDKNTHVLLSLFVMIHAIFTFYRYP